MVLLTQIINAYSNTGLLQEKILVLAVCLFKLQHGHTASLTGVYLMY